MQHASLPKVSICLLTYNRGHSVQKSLDSLLNQSHQNFELIINDDNSPDNTEKICRQYEKKDPRVMYYKNSQNLRYAGNQNAAIQRATTDYVAFVHDGDIYRPDLIEKWCTALINYPNTAIVFNSLEVMDETDTVVRVHKSAYKELIRGNELFDEMIRMPGSPIFGIVMVRKSCVLSVGPFDPRLPTLADVDMWLRLLLRYDAAYINEELFCVSMRETGHHNNSTNWNVRKEHELIYALNSARRYPGRAGEISKLRKEIMPMLWNLRLRALLYCIRYGHIREVIEGIKFIFNNLDFVKETQTDTVITWDECALE